MNTLPSTIDLSEFHIYGLLWLPGKLTWYFDGKEVHSEKTPAILDKQDFYPVLSMQEALNWKAGDINGVSTSKMNLNVDWIRIWQKK